MTNRSKECIEFRNDHESKCYLVNSDTKQTGFQRIPLSQGYEEYGNGNKMYFFEAVGKCDSSILDIIHANTREETQELINERYRERFKRNTCIPFPIREIVDEGRDNMITRNMIKNGFENGTISIEEECFGCLGICCKIGDNAFYFLGSEDDNITKEEYWESYTLDMTIDMIFDILKDSESAEKHGLDDLEIGYYESLLSFI